MSVALDNIARSLGEDHFIFQLFYIITMKWPTKGAGPSLLWPLAHDLQDRRLVLGPVVMELSGVVGDHGPGRERGGGLRRIGLAGADPPGAADHEDVAVIGMGVRL